MDGYFVHIANRLEKIRTAADDRPSGILNELKTWELWRAVLAEGIATLLFVFIGTMSAVGIVPVTDVTGNFVRIALAFGLMIAICIQMIGHVSGGHMNPAVSIAMAVAMEISPTRALFYTISQCIGAILGSLLLKGVSPSTVHSNLGLTTINSDISAGQGLACELIFTLILVTSIFGTTDPNRVLFGSPALGIGLTVTVCHLAGIPFTGASMNPARSLGSSVASDSFGYHWVYWVGPILGGICAALIYKYVFSPYNNKMKMEDAAALMMSSNDMVAIPRSYYKDGSAPSFAVTNEKSESSQF
ncbi:hypothetical protein ACF0H5_012119 [Mactra antiquata]